MPDLVAQLNGRAHGHPLVSLVPDHAAPGALGCLAQHGLAGDLDLVDHQQPELPNEQLAELLVGDLVLRNVEAEPAGGERAPVGEADLGVDDGPSLSGVTHALMISYESLNHNRVFLKCD